jgi:Uma2 family endonuclease
MSTATRLMTADELIRMADDGYRYELIAGERHRMSPAGNEHGRVAMSLGGQLFAFVKEHGLGAVYAAETGFILSRDPDTVRAPDVAFITQHRLDEVGVVAGYWPAAPDLAAEVVSPSDSYSEIADKALAWLEAGTQLVWVVDPQGRNVTVYRRPDDVQVLDAQATLDAPSLIPGWQVTVGELFS